MPSLTNLVRRGARYYFRARIPQDLVHHFGRQELLISLKTSERKIAESELIRLKASLLNEFTSLRSNTQHPKFHSPASNPHPKQTEHYSLGQLVEYWEKQAERRPRTLLEVQTTIQRFIACNGDMPAHQIEKRHVIAMKDSMREQNRAIPTIKKAISLLATVFETAVANNRMESNPARGVKLPQQKHSSKSRIPFDQYDLERLFKSPVFTQNNRPQGGRGEAAYWLPYLGLWTGARLEELGQLHVADIRHENGINYIDFNDLPNTDKHLKTSSSRRRVPIHPELIRLGFLEYIQKQKEKGHIRLFHLLRRSGSRQLTSSWSQWFSRYLREEVGIKDSRKVFHSFRHGFKEACRLSGISKDIHDQLTGHASHDVGDRYGGEHYPLPPLHQAMLHLAYPTVVAFPNPDTDN